MSGHAAVETQRLVKRFGDTLALDDVNLRVEAGSVCGLIGHNGAGKTTLLRIIFGLLRCDSGTVRILGRDAGPADVAARAALAGFVEEPAFYPHLSARRNLALLARLDARPSPPRFDETLELVGLAEARAAVGTFSTGMRQRLGLAASLLREPQLLVLDEPTIGLDPSGIRDVHALIRELAGRGVTVLLSSHNMTEVSEICDSVVIIRRGRIVWDGTLERLRREAPAPAYRLSTSDDVRALEIGHRLPGVEITPGEHRLTIRADDGIRDELVVELGRQGVAVRGLEPAVQPLEAIYVALTEGDTPR